MKKVCSNCESLLVEERKDTGVFSFYCALDDLVIVNPDNFTCSAFKEVQENKK